MAQWQRAGLPCVMPTSIFSPVKIKLCRGLVMLRFSQYILCLYHSFWKQISLFIITCICHLLKICLFCLCILGELTHGCLCILRSKDNLRCHASSSTICLGLVWFCFWKGVPHWQRGQWAPEICQAPSAQGWDYKYKPPCPAVRMGSGNQMGSSCLYNKLFVDWWISPGSAIFTFNVV